MRVQFRLNLRRLVLALIALLSFGAILLKQSDGYLRASAAVQTVVSVNAASYEPGPLARGSLASVFGNNLAPQTEKSLEPIPPIKLVNVSIQLIDSANVTHDVGLVMVSAKQINYLIPEAASPGAARIVIKNGDKPVAEGNVNITESAPALFTSGSGERKNLAVGMTSAGGVDPQGLTTTDGNPRMIGPGSPWAPTTVTLLGTGIRFASSVQIKIGDQMVDPTFVGPDAAPGVDRVSFRIPTNMRGGMNKLSLVVNTQSSAAAPSGATTQAAGATQSSATTVTSNAVQALVQGDAPAGPNTIGVDDVKTIIAQAVLRAQQLNVRATITVVDQEGNILGIFKMIGATTQVRLGSTDLTTGRPTRQLPGGMVDPDGLEQQTLPLPNCTGILCDGAALASISKAGTPAFFSTQGSAISTRTASAIIEEFFPTGISDNAGGPLFGVQFSSLPCNDTRNPLVNGLPNLPLGLAGDPGGLALYKNGLAVGGIGVEADGLYSVDLSVQDNRGPNAEQSLEEIIAAAGTRGFRPSPAFQADRILIDGMRLEYSNVPPTAADGPPATSATFDSLNGMAGTLLAPIRGQQISGFTPLTLGGVTGRVVLDPSPGVNLAGGVRRGFFPFVGSTVSNLTASDVTTILIQATQQAYRMRAAIRLSVPQPTEVNICVVDTSGAVLGVFSTPDAPQFGFNVSCQKGRTALFFSLPNAAAQLQAANANVAGIVPGLDIGKYAAQSAAFGVPLNGQFAFSSRAMGFLARPFFPDGITIKNTVNGPFSKPINFWSPFNTGLQVALVKPALVRILTGGTPPSGVPFNCSPLQNDLIFGSGIQIFAGSAALFKNGVLVGAIGVSGDGIDQDDMVAAAGSFGFEAPAAVRADQLLPQGVRLPYVKFPRHPNIGNPPPVAPIIRTSRVFPNMN